MTDIQGVANGGDHDMEPMTMDTEYGEHSGSALIGVRAGMPRVGRTDSRYLFTGRGLPTLRRGQEVYFEALRWRVYDADADGDGYLAYLVSTDCTGFVRGVDPRRLAPAPEVAR